MKRLMQQLLICALCLVAITASAAAETKAEKKAKTDAAALLVCDLKKVQTDWISDHKAIAKAKEALTALNKDVPGYKDVDFGYDGESQLFGKMAATELFTAASTKFTELIEQIASRKTRACAVCSVKKKYEQAAAGGIGDVTEAELLAPELAFVFANLANYAGLKKSNEEQKNAAPDKKAKDDLDKAFRPIQKQIEAAMTTLSEYRTAKPSAPPIAAEIAKMTCK